MGDRGRNKNQNIIANNQVDQVIENERVNKSLTERSITLIIIR